MGYPLLGGRPPNRLAQLTGCAALPSGWPGSTTRAATLLHDRISAIDLEARAAIRGTDRGNLVWAVQDLMYALPSSEIALRVMGFLAEAESENLGNNSEGLFCEAFRALHPQFPLPLARDPPTR